MDNIKIPKIQTKLQVNNSIENDVAEMYLYGTIRKAYWWEDEEDCISANRIKNVLADLKDKDINIHINSPGGDVFESIAICNLFKQYSGYITLIVDALAASGGSVICMGANKVIMLSNSMMMIHKAWTYCDGNADDLRKFANDLDKMDSAVLASYKEKFVGTDEELKALIKESSWFTAEECKSLGFCDEILDEQQEPEESKENIKNSILNKYMNKVKEPQAPKQEPQVIENKNKQAIQNLLKNLGGIN
ncbi:Clp protease [Clostridium botulinum]|uniref:head maturation protease, ClpP-related n=1 Tax=Clostridium botulinum TaxID=1491 RepID=UPI0006A70E7A|nr:head maturation protease, ClpP-related [Clostridium botulinum]KOM97080.1 Clp protease [Clostridium botulinum]KOM99497.1 Clp protease [Clostridium botulinum]MBY7004549.1 Clp protease ClpP [Clostridium botulinum]MCR1147214.1 Clp protease ClpP [Clostridium botulinum]NFH94515.1 Clp protease ClpP [Clostridium botulinum]